MYKRKIKQDLLCPLDYGRDVFGGKWKPRVLFVLSKHPSLRYSEIRKDMADITDSVLALVLKELTTYGMISRKSYDEMPPRVEYSLTERGKSVIPVLQEICRWSMRVYEEDKERTLPQCNICGCCQQRNGGTQGNEQ